MSDGIVYLVGAGPGDPGLLTRRGEELLRRADVVVVDRLVHPSLLDLAPQAEVVDVGKAPDEPGRASQERINAILVERARAGSVVVRLKGGDPFVFGRGGEECEVLADAGVRFEVVPGITSAVAGPAYAGIPLTHRDHASWVALATGREDPSKDDSALDWDALARAGTAVFLMGMRNLSDIAARLVSSGRGADTPVAVIEWATWPQQRVVRSTLERVAGDVDAAGVGNPAVIVVGGVVGLADRLDWLAAKPLLGKRVFVTRTRAQAGKLSEQLRDAGAVALEFPAVRIEPVADTTELDAALAGLAEDAYAWLVVTSQNTVDVLEQRLSDARAVRAKVAAVGRATAERLRGFGIRADLVPDTFTAAALVDAFARPEKGSRGRRRRVLVPQAEQASDEMERGLRRKGWRVDVVTAYRTVVDERSVAGGREALDAGVDAVLFTAGSTVRSFVDMWGHPPEGAVVCCIGPVTAEVAREAGVRVVAVADEHTISGLVGALVAAVRT